MKFLGISGLILVSMMLMGTTSPVSNDVDQDNILQNVSAAIQAGNAGAVSGYFDNTVSITLYSNENSYSKAQAQMVIKDFFAKNPPVSFQVIHKGSSGEGSQYGIGTLVTKTGTFRTYIYIKKRGGKFFIQEIRFEDD